MTHWHSRLPSRAPGHGSGQPHFIGGSRRLDRTPGSCILKMEIRFELVVRSSQSSAVGSANISMPASTLRAAIEGV